MHLIGSPLLIFSGSLQISKETNFSHSKAKNLQ